MPINRDVTRDVVRGLNALEMAFVNISNLSWTQHSGYIAHPTYADSIFPCFAFLSGMSFIPPRRSLGLIGLGLALQSVNAYSNGDRVRIPGVLQRLGLASFILNAPACAVLRRRHGLPLVVLWYTLSVVLAGSGNYFAHPDYPQADPSQTAQTRLDATLFGTRIYSPSHDPEGLLGALTTSISMMIGQIFVQAAERYSTGQKVLGSSLMIIAGESLDHVFPLYCPLSKGLWTPSFVLVMGGYCVLKFVAIQAVTPFLPGPVQYVLECVGQRSLEVYLISYLLEVGLLHGGSRSLWNRGLTVLARYSSRPVADLVLSTAFTGLMAATAVVLCRRAIRLSW